MRTCNGCTLCCKIERIPDLKKPPNQLCILCNSHGCSIYQYRPQACKGFLCGWITDESMDEDMRPDKVHLYVHGKLDDGILKIAVDLDYPDAWKKDKGAEVVDHVLKKAHALVVTGKQLNFLCGFGQQQPDKLVVDWLL